jgi:hypothetical protein
MCVLETERLLLRPMCEDDLDDLFALRSDPQVLQFVGQGKPWTREETAEKVRAAARHWDEHDFGMWAKLDRAGGRFVGWCGIGHWHGLPSIELGYTVAPRCWGRGLATEAVGCLVRCTRVGSRDAKKVLRRPRTRLPGTPRQYSIISTAANAGTCHGQRVAGSTGGYHSCIWAACPVRDSIRKRRR